MQPFPEELMTMWKIGRDVGNRETTVPIWSTSCGMTCSTYRKMDKQGVPGRQHGVSNETVLPMCSVIPNHPAGL
jgi:hypothetical protein